MEYARGRARWTSAGDDEVRASARVGEGAPAGFWTDARMANPISVARDHAGYAYFFEKEELKKGVAEQPDALCSRGKSASRRDFLRRRRSGEFFARVNSRRVYGEKRGSIEGLNGEAAIFGRYFHCQMGIAAKILKRMKTG